METQSAETQATENLNQQSSDLKNQSSSQANANSSSLNVPFTLNESPELKRYTLHRRFDRFARLIGDEAMIKLFNSHVMIIGIGGVGSWAAESLARSGVGKITLVDFDDICITNTNRQLHAMVGVIGQKKVHVMAERLRKINPQAEIIPIEKFYNEETSTEILNSQPDLIIDAIDNLTAKTHLLATCFAQKLNVICSGGAGSRMNPLLIEVADLSKTHKDPFLVQIRRILRTKYNIDTEETLNIPTIFSTETPITPHDLSYDKGMGFKCVCPQGQNNFHSCDKRSVIHGTASFLTGSFGLIASSKAVEFLLAGIQAKTDQRKSNTEDAPRTSSEYTSQPLNI